MEGCSLFEAARRLQAMTCSPALVKSAPSGKELVTKRRRVSLPLKFTLTGIDYSHPYLAERGITEKTAIEFGVGLYPGPGLMHGRLVIPIHNADGELIAYCGRSVDQTATTVPAAPGLHQVGDPFQHAPRCRRGGKHSRSGGGILRLHESVPSRHSGGRRANGIGSL
jgi:hypothetical protein